MLPGFIIPDAIPVAFYVVRKLLQMSDLFLIAESPDELLDVFQHSINIPRMKILQDSLTHLFPAFLLLIYGIDDYPLVWLTSTR